MSYNSNQEKDSGNFSQEYYKMVEQHVKAIFESGKEEWVRLSMRASKESYTFKEYYRKAGLLVALGVAVLVFILSDGGTGSRIFGGLITGIILAAIAYLPALIIYKSGTKRAKEKYEALQARLHQEAQACRDRDREAYIQRILQIRDYYLQSNHYGPVLEWAMGYWSRAISQASRASYLSHVTVTVKIQVEKNVITLSCKDQSKGVIDKYEKSDYFFFQHNNYTDLPDYDSCMGFAQMLAVSLRAKLLDKYEFDYSDQIRDENEKAKVTMNINGNIIPLTYTAVNGNYIPPIDNTPEYLR